MLPILGLFQLRARDATGCTFVVFLACRTGPLRRRVLGPVMVLLVTLLGATLSYPL